MIKVSAQQRANAIEARDVLWPSISPAQVSERLMSWRKGQREKAPPDCHTIACFGGWCQWHPPFRAIDDGTGKDIADYSRTLFGFEDLFEPRECCASDNQQPTDCTDHELVTRRLNWLILNSEVAS